MDNIIEILSQNWLGSLIGIIGIIIGIIVAFYFYRLSRIGPRLVFQMNTLKIIGKDDRMIPDDVKIFFGDSQVEKLIKNTIIIWNSGYSTFDGDRIIKSNPLRAEYNDSTCIMRSTPIKETRPENKASAEIDHSYRNKVIFSFDYLEPQDGAVFEIYHNGEDTFPTLTGTIKGMRKGIENWGIIRPPQKETPIEIENPIIIVIVGLATLFLGIIFIIFIIIMLFTSIISLINGIPRGEYSSAIFLFVPIFPLYLFYDYWTKRRKFPKSLLIDELK